jgi:thymidylate kinase
VTPLEAVVARVSGLPHPWRVGVDGVTAAGKTTFADALGRRVRARRAHERYATRYVPGETRYLDEVDPASHADVVIDMTDLAQPRLLRG